MIMVLTIKIFDNSNPLMNKKNVYIAILTSIIFHNIIVIDNEVCHVFGSFFINMFIFWFHVCFIVPEVSLHPNTLEIT